MKSKLLVLALIAGSATMLAGCDELLSEGGWDLVLDWLGTPDSNLRLQDASMTGDLSTVQGLVAPSAQIEPGYDSLDYTTFTLTGQTERGLIMQIVEVDGGLDNLDEPGTYTNNCDDTYDEQTSEAPLMIVTGCSKEDPDGGWDYDAECEESTIIVEEDPADPDVLMYTLSSTFREDSWGWDDNDDTYTVVSHFSARRDALDGDAPTETAPDDDISEWVVGQMQGGNQ